MSILKARCIAFRCRL